MKRSPFKKNKISFCDIHIGTWVFRHCMPGTESVPCKATYLLEMSGCSWGWKGLPCWTGAVGLVRPSIAWQTSRHQCWESPGKKGTFKIILEGETRWLEGNAKRKKIPVFALLWDPLCLGTHSFWRCLHNSAHEPGPSGQMWSNPPGHQEAADSGTSAVTPSRLASLLLPNMCPQHKERSVGSEVHAWKESRGEKYLPHENKYKRRPSFSLWLGFIHGRHECCSLSCSHAPWPPPPNISWRPSALRCVESSSRLL